MDSDRILSASMFEELEKVETVKDFLYLLY
jgi:hypothetical protein